MIPEPAPRVVSGKYALRRALGSGASSTVFEAENLLIGKRVALKLLSAELAAVTCVADAFLAEARVSARLDHPNIVDILDTGIDRDGRPYIVMELLEGETLDQILERRGPLPIPYACELMLQVLAAVDVAHAAGIVHRDLKPTNVAVTHTRPDRPQVKVFDFGIAQGVMDASTPRVAACRWIGSPAYMAPEQGLSCTVDARADVYSASVMLYELLTGELPHEAGDLQELLVKSIGSKFIAVRDRNPSIPPALAEIIESGLAGHRDRRLASARELAEGLLQFVPQDRRESFRASGMYPSFPLPLVAKKEGHRESAARILADPHLAIDAASSWHVIGWSDALDADSLLHPVVPRAPSAPRFEIPTADLAATPAPRRARSRVVSAGAAVCAGFGVGLAVAWAVGLL